MSGEEGEEPRPANIYIHGLISIVREGDQGAAWLECGKLGLGVVTSRVDLFSSCLFTASCVRDSSVLGTQECRTGMFSTQSFSVLVDFFIQCLFLSYSFIY